MEDKIYQTKEEKDYVEYVNKHITRVRNSYNERGREIAIVLGLSESEIEDLVNRIATHDQSKYGSEEMEGYRQNFNPAPGEKPNKELFEKAWKHHYENNDHHPEYWKGKDMPKVAIAELICDWESMSRTFGGNPLEYFEKNKDKKKKEMSENTFNILCEVLPKLYDINQDLRDWK